MPLQTAARALLTVGICLGAFAANAKGHKRIGYVFTNPAKAKATLVCSERIDSDKCFLLVEGAGTAADGKTQYLAVDGHGSEYHFMVDDERFATVYLDGARAYKLTVWKNKSGKQVDMAFNDLKSEALDAEAFYKDAAKKAE